MLKSFLKLTNLMIECRNVPVVDEEGLTLFPSEQHFMCLLNENPHCNAKELAEMQGVTKGAVSQVVKKLEAKGILNQVANEDDRKSKSLQLTPMGVNQCEIIDRKIEDRETGFYHIWEQYDEDVIEQCSEIFEKMADLFRKDLP